jgi:hypothetical protein
MPKKDYSKGLLKWLELPERSGGLNNTAVFLRLIHEFVTRVGVHTIITFCVALSTTNKKIQKLTIMYTLGLD